MQKAAAFLKNLRQEKGYAIEEVSKGTNMSPSVIRALEDGRLDGIDRVYLKGFLKLYCRFLGVEWEPFLKDYALVFSASVKHPYRSQQEEKPKREPLKFPSWGGIYRKYKKTILLFLYIFCAFILLILAVKFFGFIINKAVLSARARSSPRANSLKTKKDTVKVLQKKIPAPIAQNKQEERAPQEKLASSVRAGVLVKEDSFIKVALDGNIIYQGVMRKGAQESWKAKEKIELSVGNAAGVELESEGKRFSPLGRRGQVLKNIVINREGVDIK